MSGLQTARWTANSIIKKASTVVVGDLCDHCGRKMNNFAGGYSRGFNNEKLCNPNVANRPNCYKLVTMHGHPMPCDSDICREDHADQAIYTGDRVIAKLVVKEAEEVKSKPRKRAPRKKKTDNG